MSDDASAPRDPFDVKLDMLERRAKHLLAMLASLAAALVATILIVVAGWQQIQSAMRDVDQKVLEVDTHAMANDQRLDAINAPAPRPLAASGANP